MFFQMNLKRKIFLLALMVLAVLSCGKSIIIDKPVIVPIYPDLEDNKADTLVTTQAKIQFYGAYSETVDRWYLTLFEKDGVKYVHEDDEYIGEGQVVILCLQTAISNGQEADIPVIEGTYSCPSSYSDLLAGQFEFGYDYPYDHPYKGIRYATYGSYVIDLDESEYIPRYAGDGAFEVRRLADGNYLVDGMLVDTGFKKHYFKYEGPISGVTEWNYYQAANSSLRSDVVLTRSELPALNMRRTELPFGNSKDIDIIRMYLSSNDVVVGPQVSYGTETLSGSGEMVVLEMVVKHGESTVPAGTYSIAPRVDGGYDGSYLTPFHFKEGMPNRYTNREGSWYFNLAENGHWSGDYAQIHDGTVTISYEEGKDTPVISAKMVDCFIPAHKIIIDWK